MHEYRSENDGEGEYGGYDYEIYKYVNDVGRIETIFTSENGFCLWRIATILKPEAEYIIQNGKYYIA